MIRVLLHIKTGDLCIGRYCYPVPEGIWNLEVGLGGFYSMFFEEYNEYLDLGEL